MLEEARAYRPGGVGGHFGNARRSDLARDFRRRQDKAMSQYVLPVPLLFRPVPERRF